MTAHLERGALAGIVGGLGYGLFLATVGNSFIAGLETFESGHGHGGPVDAALSVGGGALWGLLFGVAVFGIGYYFLEPALPGDGLTARLALAAAGFLTVSGAPWLVFPPQPPGVEQTLPSAVRLSWYAGSMIAGALVASCCGLAYRRTTTRRPAVTLFATLCPLALLAVPVVLAPANPTTVDVPGSLVTAYRWTVVFGQLGLWVLIAAVHTWLGDGDTVVETEPYAAISD